MVEYAWNKNLELQACYANLSKVTSQELVQ